MGAGASASKSSSQPPPAPESSGASSRDPELVRPIAPQRRRGQVHQEERLSTSTWNSDEGSIATTSEDDNYSFRGSLDLPLATSLSDVQTGKVQQCLSHLATFLDVSFNVALILPHVKPVTYQQNERVLTREEEEEEDEAMGIFVVDKGVLEVLSPSGDTVLNRLLPGQFCGELSTLFATPCTASVLAKQRVELLRLPAHCVRDNMHGELDGSKMLDWCAKRSYVDTAGLFAPGALSRRATSLCIKASQEFSGWSSESIDHIATLTAPILFSSGEVVYSSGEDSCHMFFILRGPVEISRTGQALSSKYVKTSDEGYCIGIREVLLGLQRGDSARAVGSLLLVPVSRDTLLEAVTKYPSETERLRELIERSRTAS